MRDETVRLQVEVQQFLNHEAVLLEENRFRDWLDQLTDDIRYRMPVRRTLDPSSGTDASDESVFCLFDDDKKSLIMRTMRLETQMAHAEIPPSVTQRIISNIIVDCAEDAKTLEVSSRFVVFQERLGRHAHTFYGRRNDRLLRGADGKLRIALREIQLAQTILPTTLSIFF